MQSLSYYAIAFAFVQSQRGPAPTPSDGDPSPFDEPGRFGERLAALAAQEAATPGFAESLRIVRGG